MKLHKTINNKPQMIYRLEFYLKNIKKLIFKNQCNKIALNFILKILYFSDRENYSLFFLNYSLLY